MLSKITSHKHYGLVGFFLILASYIHWFLPLTVPNLAIGHFIFLLGNILLFDSISYELGGYSLLKTISKNKIKFFLGIGVVCGYFLELLDNSFAHIWYYPPLTTFQYGLFMTLGFGFYFLYLIESYLGVKAILIHFFKKHKRKPENFRKLRILFIAVGFIGTVGLGASTLYLSLKSGSILINQSLQTSESLFFPAMFVLFFLFLFLDYLEYERHETSLIFNIYKGNLIPLFAVLLASFMCSLVYESFVVPTGIWRYMNIPFQETKILGIPLFVIIFWPLQYFALIAFYRVLFKKETEKIYD